MCGRTERLLSLRRRLRSDVDEMAGSVLEKPRAEANGDLSYMPIHMADVASDDFERQFTLSLIESEDETLDQIERVLQCVLQEFFIRRLTGCELSLAR